MMNIENYKIYQKPNKDVEKQFWEKSIFVFDSSALLNFYYIPSSKLQEIFNEIFERIKDRLWIPNHVEFEFFKNRESVILKPITEKYNPLKENYLHDTKKSIDKIIKNIEDLKNNTKKEDKHPFIEQKAIDDFLSKTENFKTDYTEFEKTTITLLEEQIEKIKAIKQDDIVLNSFTKYFKVGRKYNYSEIIDIIKEGKLRYEFQIPPGYKDIDDKEKIGIQIFGDLIIWKQIIEFAKETKKPILLIVDDLKQDWCEKDKKNPERIELPNFDLIREMFDIAGVPVWFYSLPQFLHNSKNYLQSNINDEIIEIVQQSIAKDLDDNKKKQYLKYKCNKCGKISTICEDEFSMDYECMGGSERSMGEENWYQAKEYINCPKCDNYIEIEFNVWEYPVGFQNYDSIEMEGAKLIKGIDLYIDFFAGDDYDEMQDEFDEKFKNC